jgi:hypothetical protein
VRGRGAAWRGLANRIDLVVLILSVIYMNFLFSNLFFIHFAKNILLFQNLAKQTYHHRDANAVTLSDLPPWATIVV